MKQVKYNDDDLGMHDRSRYAWVHECITNQSVIS